MRRRLAMLPLLVLALTLAPVLDRSAATAQPKQKVQAPSDEKAQPPAKKTQFDKKAPSEKKAEPRIPLRIYLAKGGINACGQGCSEWIAIDGSFDEQAAVRVRSFLQRHGARKLPVYFHSPGGHGRAAMAIGRDLRARGLTTGVAMTMPRACAASENSDACRAARQSQQPIEAEWRPSGYCNSACVYALIGGRVRQVPPLARLGVHSVRVTFMLIRRWSDGRVQHLTEKQLPALQKTRVAEFNAELRRYIADMGIAPALFETAAKIRHEDIHYLSRNEIAGYGIDRRALVETPWYLSEPFNDRVSVIKRIVEATAEDRSNYRTNSLFLTCSTSLWEHANLLYSRGLGEGGPPVTITLSIGSYEAIFPLSGKLIQQKSMFSPGSSASVNDLPFDQIEAAAAADAIKVVETPMLAVEKQPRVYELSTHGLLQGLKALRATCAPSTQRLP